MTVIPIGPKYCEKARKYLDSYINNELMVETNHELLKHLEDCEECSRMLHDRLRVRNRLKQAMNREAVSPALQQRVQKAIRQEAVGFSPVWPRSVWFLAAAATLVLCLGGWGIFHLWKLNRGAVISPQADLPQGITEQTTALLKIGVGDHIHCVVEHHDAKGRSTLEQMARDLGPDYYGLVALVNAQLPKGFVVSVAHQCDVNGRRFVHLIFKDQQSVASLVITKKGGEGFPVQDRIAGLSPSAPVLHQREVNGYDVVGFETKTYFGFVVSSLDKEQNLQIASGLAPAVDQFLAGLEI
jgi:hypothetical protein